MADGASFRLQPALTIDGAAARNGLGILSQVFETSTRAKGWQAA